MPRPRGHGAIRNSQPNWLGCFTRSRWPVGPKFRRRTRSGRPSRTEETGERQAGERPAAEITHDLLPVRIISELLGVPPEEHARFAGWSAKLAHSVQPSFGSLDPVELTETERAALDFAGYFTELIAVRR